MVVVLGVARWLEPDAKGYGTHQQLGLPPCSSILLFGSKCPACGMTPPGAWRWMAAWWMPGIRMLVAWY